jgi:UDP-N-acetylmuramoylalanine--D-glutamate ligase
MIKRRKLIKRKQVSLAGKRVLVMGLGRFGGGVGVSRFLVGEGAQVTVTDSCGQEELSDSLGMLADIPISFHLGGHKEEDFRAVNTDMVVVNPAVRKDSPYLRIARREKLELTSEMNMFFERCPAKIVGITGSNGKSTVTAITAAVLERGLPGQEQVGYHKVWVGGNIGRENLLSRVGEIGTDDVVVLELSSFQLFDLGRIKRSPQVAVLTNIAPNHLDWHGSMKEYVRAKQNILHHQKAGDFAILNRREADFTDWARFAQGEVIWYPQPEEKPIELQVPGEHNRTNAAAALAVGELFGVEPTEARRALSEFTGLPHRLELAGEIDGVRYYNDSVATTPESALAALQAFTEEKVMILGGYDKKISFAALVEELVNSGTVKNVVLMGQVADALAEQIKNCRDKQGASMPMVEKAESLTEAVALARQKAQPGMVVLLSPACASYDMFSNFQQRGEQFRQLVKKLKN